MATTEREPRSGDVLAVEAGASSRTVRSDLRTLAGVARSDTVLRRALAVGDAASVFLALSATLALAGGPSTGRRLLWGLVAVPLMVVLFKLYGLYDRDVKRLTYSTVD